MQSMPSLIATAPPAPAGAPEGLLGRDPLGEQSHATPVMSVHQLGSQDQFVVSSQIASLADTCTIVSIAKTCICGLVMPFSSQDHFVVSSHTALSPRTYSYEASSFYLCSCKPSCDIVEYCMDAARTSHCALGP